MKQIEVHRPVGHKRADEASMCLPSLLRAGIPVYFGKVGREGSALWIGDDADHERALLRADGFDVT
jgi:hypothetical protein